MGHRRPAARLLVHRAVLHARLGAVRIPRPRAPVCGLGGGGGASPGVMLGHAADAIAAGRCHTVLVCAGENRATGQSRDQTLAALSAVGHPYFEAPYGASIPALYALIARRHMHEF